MKFNLVIAGMLGLQDSLTLYLKEWKPDGQPVWSHSVTDALPMEREEAKEGYDKMLRDVFSAREGERIGYFTVLQENYLQVADSGLESPEIAWQVPVWVPASIRAESSA